MRGWPSPCEDRTQVAAVRRSTPPPPRLGSRSFRPAWFSFEQSRPAVLPQTPSQPPCSAERRSSGNPQRPARLLAGEPRGPSRVRGSRCAALRPHPARSLQSSALHTTVPRARSRSPQAECRRADSRTAPTRLGRTVVPIAKVADLRRWDGLPPSQDPLSRRWPPSCAGSRADRRREACLRPRQRHEPCTRSLEHQDPAPPTPVGCLPGSSRHAGANLALRDEVQAGRTRGPTRCDQTGCVRDIGTGAAPSKART